MGGWIPFAPVLLALALLIIALARPRLGRGSTDIESSGIDIMLTVDVSGSMEAMDFTLNGQPSNRLEVVKDVIAKFTQQRANDKIGLVAFRPALSGQPSHPDRNWLGQRIGSLKIGLVEDGTAIGSALVSAVSHLKDSKAKSRIIILLTDGVNNNGAANPETSAEAAKALGIKIYTIRAGTNGEAPMPVRDPFGGVALSPRESGNRRTHAHQSRRTHRKKNVPRHRHQFARKNLRTHQPTRNHHPQTEEIRELQGTLPYALLPASLFSSSPASSAKPLPHSAVAEKLSKWLKSELSPSLLPLVPTWNQLPLHGKCHAPIRPPALALCCTGGLHPSSAWLFSALTATGSGARQTDAPSLPRPPPCPEGSRGPHLTKRILWLFACLLSSSPPLDLKKALSSGRSNAVAMISSSRSNASRSMSQRISARTVSSVPASGSTTSSAGLERRPGWG